MAQHLFTVFRSPGSRIRFGAVALAMIAAITTPAQGQRKIFTPGQPGIIFDERLSALREQPDVKAPLKQRMRRGRRVGILGSRTAKDGAKFFRVAVSRNTRGWVLADAVIRPGAASDAEKLMRLIEETKDDFAKARLARLCADEFRAANFAPKALMILGEAAESEAAKLSRDAKRRVGEGDAGAGPNPGRNSSQHPRLTRRDFMLNYAGLDRYNRIGVTFDYDSASDRIVYDGAAYRELLRRYPRSSEARAARERLGKSGAQVK